MTMQEGPPRRLEDGRILAQVPTEGPDGQVVEALLPIGPDHPLWKTWDDWLTQRDQ